MNLLVEKDEVAIWTPKDPNYEEKVRSSFARQPMMRTLGVEIERIEPGEVALSIPFSTAFAQQHGFLHAGAVSTVLDSACGYAAFSLMPAEAAILTVNNSLNLLAPADAERFIAVATVTKPGKTISVAEATFSEYSNPTKPMATMTATLIALVDRGIEQ